MALKQICFSAPLSKASLLLTTDFKSTFSKTWHAVPYRSAVEEGFDNDIGIFLFMHSISYSSYSSMQLRNTWREYTVHQFTENSLTYIISFSIHTRNDDIQESTRFDWLKAIYFIIRRFTRAWQNIYIFKVYYKVQRTCRLLI